MTHSLHGGRGGGNVGGRRGDCRRKFTNCCEVLRGWEGGGVNGGQSKGQSSEQGWAASGAGSNSVDGEVAVAGSREPVQGAALRWQPGGSPVAERSSGGNPGGVALACRAEPLGGAAVTQSGGVGPLGQRARGRRQAAVRGAGGGRGVGCR
ncbi:glycine-rich protein DOT1-like [Cryptomeria japonica]|uniref:glycine-rich protein DOT1-like n=1 Tax=Cryptomeria japonica TaxID=3369 RepID=UPI0027DA08D2|nr:glycine-rich protein DOT1-like [Cryptomeria japonica]